MRETFTNASERLFGTVVPFDLVPPSNKVIHLIGINSNRSRFSHTHCNAYKVFDGIITIKEKSNHTRKPAQKHFGNDHHHHDFVQQRMADRLFFVRIVVFEVAIFQFFLDSLWNKVVYQSCEQYDGTFVEHIDNNIGKELRRKTIPMHNVVERDRKWSRNALAKIESIQSISKNGPQAATNKR